MQKLEGTAITELVEGGKLTNLVFDGSVPCRNAHDAACPVTEYGRQKAEAEKQLLALGNMAAVVRVHEGHGPRYAAD
jgi:hypothetical protein